jgi:hypothetical protein
VCVRDTWEREGVPHHTNAKDDTAANDEVLSGILWAFLTAVATSIEVAVTQATKIPGVPVAGRGVRVR